MMGTKPWEADHMDTYENTPFPGDGETPQTPPEETPPVQSPSPDGPGLNTGRKESPYANSPYVMQAPEQPEYRYQPQTQPPQKPPKAHKPRKPFWKSAAALLLVLTLVAGGCLITAFSVNEYWEKRTRDTVNMLNGKIDDLQKQLDGVASGGQGIPLPSDGGAMSPSQLYRSNVSSVVAISSTIETMGFYGPATGSSTGSGFILTEDGYVVTNYHLVDGAVGVNVVLHDGTEYEAEVIGYDATNDLAVLKIEAEGLSAATLGSSDELIIGDMVVAIGNPLGELTATQTVGYVSGINREVTTDNTIINMIQTDAAINPGNSGGPLFNMRGEVIGITTAKYSGTTNSGASIEGIGFAIPIDDVMSVISDLIDYGYVTGAYLGVTVQNTDAESASMFGLPTGAYVVTVEKDGCASRAGIQPKDIIIDLGGTKVSNITDLTRALRHFKAGDETTVTVIRGGKEITLDVTLDERPQQTEPIAPESDPNLPSDGDFNEWYDYFRRYFGE